MGSEWHINEGKRLRKDRLVLERERLVCAVLCRFVFLRRFNRMSGRERLTGALSACPSVSLPAFLSVWLYFCLQCLQSFTSAFCNI